MIFADFDAAGAGVVEQDFVEGGAPDLVGVGVGAVGFPEVPAPGFGVAAPKHCRAPFLWEAGVFYLIEDAKVFEYRHGGGQKRFAYVFAGESLAFQQNYVVALTSEQGGGRTAAWPAAYDYHIGLFGLGNGHVR